jgi:hypothetical protein
MSQRAYVELTRLGHEASIGLATSEWAMFEAVRRHSPELIVAPMLKLRDAPGSRSRVRKGKTTDEANDTGQPHRK